MPDPGSTIDGLIAPVPAADWAALDAREGAYTRRPAAHQVRHALPHRPEIAVYAIPDAPDRPAPGGHALLLSYIDVVVQGYLREFGPDGAARFFATTDGWDAPVIDDRARPRYARHCRLSTEETECVNGHLNGLGVDILRP